MLRKNFIGTDALGITPRSDTNSFIQTPSFATSEAAMYSASHVDPATTLCLELHCNAPDPMRPVSASYSPSFPCHLLACCIFPCHHLHFISCHHVHRIGIRVRLLHPSIFPVICFAIRHSYVLRRLPFASSLVRMSNVLGMARGLSSGLGIAPVDHLSSLPFGGRLILQRLTG